MIERSSSSDAQVVVLGLIEALNDEGKTAAVLDRFSRSGALNDKVADYRVAYPNFRIRPLDAFSERDLVVVRFMLDLEGSYRVDGGAADAQAELLEAIALCRVEGAVITEMWFEMDLFAQVVERIGDPARHENQVPVNEVVAVPNAGTVVAASAGDLLADNGANRSLVLRYLAALNYKYKTPELIERFASDVKLVESIMAFEAGFPGYALLADEIVAAGDRVAVRFHTSQRHTHPYMGIPATGLDLSITGIVIYRVVAGKIVEHWLQADTWALLQRLQDSLPDAAQAGTGTPETKRQFIDRRVRGSEYTGAERRHPQSAIVDRR